MAELRIESKKAKVNKSADAIFKFLTNMNNFEGLFNDSRIKNWKSTDEYCTFEVEGAGSIGFIIDKKDYPYAIVYKNYGNVPFDYILEINISDIDADNSEVFVIFTAEVNPMFKMMLKNPLTNLLNSLMTRLEEVKI